MTRLNLNHVPQDVISVCQTLWTNGFDAWVVGGAVRDLIRAGTPHDWDVATDARPTQVAKLFRSPGCSVISTGEAHGTMTVMFGPGRAYEVTTFRGDGDYQDGRHPDRVVFKNSIEEDLARRDFTMNAIALNPVTGELRDPFGGLEDIQQGVIRAVGDPLERFAEDGLRPLRACRFAATLQMGVDLAIMEAIPARLGVFKMVAAERVQQEWLKCLQATYPSVGFRLMAETGLLDATSREFAPMRGCHQNQYHEHDVWNHTLAVLDACPQDPILRLAALLHDVGKPATCQPHPTRQGDNTFYEHEHVSADVARQLLHDLRFSTADLTRVVHLVKHHYIRYEPSWTDSAIRRWVQRVGDSHVVDLIALARADIQGKGQAKTPLDEAVLDELQVRLAAIRQAPGNATGLKQLTVTGKDLLDIGIPQGPRVGQVLNALLEWCLDDPSRNTREALLAHAATIA